jgi:hypothetical protein
MHLRKLLDGLGAATEPENQPFSTGRSHIEISMCYPNTGTAIVIVTYERTAPHAPCDVACLPIVLAAEHAVSAVGDHKSPANVCPRA